MLTWKRGLFSWSFHPARDALRIEPLILAGQIGQGDAGRFQPAHEFGEAPVMTVSMAGYGTGKKDFEVLNAVRVLLVRVAAEKQLPFELKTPNAVTRAAMAEAEDIVKTRRARFQNAEEVFNAIEEAGQQ